MPDLYKPWWVKWHTKPAPGATYYTGWRRVFADDAEGAKAEAIRSWHRTFKEYSRDHIIIDEVRDTRPPTIEDLE